MDDQPANLLVLKALLDELQQNLVEARSGEEAIGRLMESDFAVVLMDIQMPGLDGFEAAKKIRSAEKLRHTPIIFLTAYEDDRFSAEMAYSLGAVDYLVKPLVPVIVKSKVRSFVELFQQKERAKQEASQLRLLIDGTSEYAIFMLDPAGRIVTWNTGAERLKGYQAREIIGQHFSRFYPREAVERGWPDHELKVARKQGRFEDEGWRVRKDGSTFWANVVITSLRDEAGHLRGFSKVTRDMTERMLAEENARNLAREEAARRAAEEQAKLTEQEREKLRVTLASIGDAVISTDAEGRVTFLNQVAEELIGWSMNDAAQRNLSDVFHIVSDHTRQPVENPALRALAEGAVVGLANHTVLISKDGTERPIDDSAAPIRDANKQVVGSVLVFRDISARKQAEIALRESEGRHRFLAELASATQSLTEPDEIMSTAARLLAEHLKVDRCAYAEIEDESVFIITGDHSRGVDSIVGRWPVSAFGVECTRCMLANEAFVIDDVDKDPRITVSDLTAYRATAIQAVICVPLRKAGEFSAAMAVHQTIARRWTPEEITLVTTVVDRCWEALERTKVTRTLKESEQRFRSLANSVPVHVWMDDEQGRRILANARYIEYTGQSAEELEMDSWSDVIHPEDKARYLADYRAAASARIEYRSEVRLQRHDGVYHWFETFAHPRFEGERFAGYVGIRLDVTDRKQAQEALKDADRRKDEFLATLAHELRNPLAPICTSLQILNMPRVDAATALETREMMERQVHHLVRLVDDLLDVSRVMRGKIELRKEYIELATVVARAVETTRPLIDAQGHQLEIDVPNESLLMNADPVRIAQVIGNLLTNAAKYTEANGRISIVARREEGMVDLTVRDNGIGIAPDVLAHVFELFVQADHSTARSQGGLGIGLTLVKNLVEMHGGTIEARSAGLGKGSEFLVRLPLLAEKRELSVPHDGQLPPEPVRASGRRVIVVDDNMDAAVTLAMLLRFQGHDVRIAHDGATALELATFASPDIVFLDIGMPGMDGYEVARRMRQIPGLEDVILAALTGWGQQEDRRRTAAAGFDHHLVKPPESAELEKVLAEVSRLPNHSAPKSFS